MDPKILPPPLREALHRWRGWRTVNLGGHLLRVLPYDRRFWDGVDAGTCVPDTLRALRECIRPGANYCDLGAWIGPTALFARQCGAKVACFEPDPLAYERLLGNLRLNAAFEVRAFPCAVGAADGIRKMGAMVGSPGKSTTSFFGTAAEQTVDVPCFAWETAVRLFRLPDFDVIKIDIEGGEAELLPVLMPTLERRRPVVLLSTHWSFLPDPARAELCRSLARLAKIYGDVSALGKGGGEPVDLADPGAPARNSVFLLRPGTR